MSPEQILGLPVDGRSDLFSAGVILYQFLTGERPFTGSANTTMQKVLKEEPLPPSTLNVQLPGAIDAVVRKALAKKPDERFQTAREFADALRAAGADDPDATVRAATAPPVVTPMRTVAATSGAVPAAPRKSQATAIAVVAGVVVLAGVAGAWMLMQRSGEGTGSLARTVPANATGAIAPAPLAATQSPSSAAADPASTPPAATTPTATSAAPAPSAPSAVASAPDAGTVVISAVGLVDSTDPRYQTDPSLLQADLRADSKGQLVEKALGLMLAKDALAKNYDVLQARLLAHSANFVGTVYQESAPQTGRDGLVSLTTQAAVNVRALQKSLNQMSREERIDLIRANGDPKVAVRIAVSDVDQPGAPPLPSPGGGEPAQGTHQDVRLSHLVGRRKRGQAERRFPGAGRGEDQAAVDAPRSLRSRRHQVRADVVDGEVHRSRHRRGDLLQHRRCRRVSAAGPARSRR